MGRIIQTTSVNYEALTNSDSYVQLLPQRAPPITGDPYFGNVVLLLNGNGANGATTTVDSSSYAATVSSSGTVALTTAAFKANNSSSMDFTTGTGRFYVPPASQYAIGNNDFTFDLWMNPASLQPSPFPAILVSQRFSNTFTTDAAFQILVCQVYGSPEIDLYMYSGNNQYAARWILDPFVFITGTWHHLEIGRKYGAFLGAFCDGVPLAPLAGLPSNALNVNSISYPLNVGCLNFSGVGDTDPASAYLQNVRFTNGICRHTSGFTPPTPPFPNSA